MSISIQNVGNDLLNSLWLIQSRNQTFAAASTGSTSTSPVMLTPQEQAQLGYSESLLQTLYSGNQDAFSLTSSLLHEIAASAGGLSGDTTQSTSVEQTQLSYNANLMQMLNPGTQENSTLVAYLLQHSIDLYQ
jgi:hypothetical protein